MANPPPVRPWFRLASLRSVPPAAPALAPPSSQTQPSQPSQPNANAARFVGAAVRERASAPSSPPQKVSTPSASLPSSPSLKPSQPPTASSLDKASRATKSPQTRRPAAQSPKLKLTTPPPSPQALPTSQLKVNPEVESKIPVEADTKTMQVQKTIEKPRQGIANHGKLVTAKENETKGKGIHAKVFDSLDHGIRAITIAGENKGAYMEIIQSSKKPSYLLKKGNSNINKAYDDYESENSGNANRKDKSQKVRTLFSPPMTAYVNSNVQCVNNSLLNHTSCTSHDPGVHLTLSKKPFGEGLHLKERGNGQNN